VSPFYDPAQAKAEVKKVKSEKKDPAAAAAAAEERKLKKKKKAEEEEKSVHRWYVIGVLYVKPIFL
jgi:hypothetical protein